MVAPSERQRPMWIGKGLVLNEPVELPPGARPQVKAIFSSLAFPEDFSTLRVSTRSRDALSGLEIISTGQELIQKLDPQGEATTQVRIKNHGRRVVLLHEGREIGKPYIEAETNIEGKELKALLGKKIHIGGIPHCWAIVENENQESIGIRLDINPQSRQQILPGRRPIMLNGEHNYRGIIDKLTGPPDPSMDESFWFAETYAHIKIDKGIVGILQDPISSRVHMLNSHLMYGGQTDWSIRVEFVGPTVSTEMPTHIDMVFQKAA